MAMSGSALADLPCDLWVSIIRKWLPARVAIIRDLDVAFCNNLIRPLYLNWIQNMEIDGYPFEVLRSTDITGGRVKRTLFIHWLVKRKLFITSIYIDCSDTSSLEFLDGVVSANPQLLSKVHKVTTAEYPDLSTVHRSPVLNVLRHLTNITCVLCDELDSDPGPWVHLPDAGRVTSLRLSVYNDNMLKGQTLHDQLPNLEKLAIFGSLGSSGQSEDFLDALRSCARLPNLKKLELHHLYCTDGDIAPDQSQWEAFPPMLSLKKLTVYDVLPEENVGFIKFMLDRCPNVNSLIVTVCGEDQGDVLATLNRKLPDLHYLHWDNLSSRFRVVAEAVNGNRFGDSMYAQSDSDSAPPSSLSPDDTAFFQSTVLLRTVSLKKFACHFIGNEGFKVLSVDLFGVVGRLHNLTALHFFGALLPAVPDIWAAVLSLPVLRELSFKLCVNLHESFAVGLADCAAKGVRSTNVQNLTVTDKGQTGNYSTLCFLLSKVFSSLTHLSLLIPSVTGTMILDVLFNLSALRRLEVRGGAEGDFLKTMTSEMWKAVARVSGCHCWEIHMSDLDIEWNNLKRMIDSLGAHLHDLHILDDKDKKTELEEPAKEYLRQRRFRLTRRKKASE